jgi:dipeptidyl aminopeptidase/acylaminoacyl peptidase
MKPLEHIRFENEGLNLYATLHRPDGPDPHPAVVMCHGFTGHRLEANCLFVKCARRLAAAGIAVFRFDCRFSGESDGDFQDMTIAGEVSDANSAVDTLIAQPGIDGARLGILGFSMGGTVAPLTAASRDDIRTMVLWAPVSDPARQFARFLPDIGDADTLDIGGYVLGKGFIEDLPAHRPVDAARRWGGPIRIIRGTEDLAVTLDSARAYLDGPNEREFLEVEGTDHGWIGHAHQERLFDATVGWFRETL